MLSSMTGFGSARVKSDSCDAKVEIRSVNHRYADAIVRLPKKYIDLEERVRNVAREYVARGRLEIFVSIEEFRGRERTVRLDEGLLDGYVEAFRQAAEDYPIAGSLTLEALTSLPELFVIEEEESDSSGVWPTLEEALREAFERLAAMRKAEGNRLLVDIDDRLSALNATIAQMATRAPAVVEETRRRLLDRISQLLDDPPVDEQRLAMEVALFADKANIDEELVRARSHLEAFQAAVESGEAVGRKLDFLLQELNREFNTIASKANDATLATLAVEAKAELEKIREQVQNIE